MSQAMLTNEQITEINKFKSDVINKYNCQISNDKNELTATIKGHNQEQYKIKITLPNENGVAFAVVQKITMMNGQNIKEVAEVNDLILKSCCVYDSAGALVFGEDLNTKKTWDLRLLSVDVFNQIKSMFFLFLV